MPNEIQRSTPSRNPIIANMLSKAYTFESMFYDFQSVGRRDRPIKPDLGPRVRSPQNPKLEDRRSPVMLQSHRNRFLSALNLTAHELRLDMYCAD
jgi:hypothetical protein